MEQICNELNPGYPHEFAHLDPDLRPQALASRPKGWRPAFGQSGAAAGLLVNQGVGIGDLFVFFGWFRRTKDTNGKLTFDRADIHGRHIVFGWLEVGTVVDKLPPPNDMLFLNDHPHIRNFDVEDRPNKIYVSSEFGLKAGAFRNESEAVVLTQKGESRSRWLLDEAFESLSLERDLSYHRNEFRWGREGTGIKLQTVGRGQEFVFDGERHQKAQKYFVDRIGAGPRAPHQCPHDV